MCFLLATNAAFTKQKPKETLPLARSRESTMSQSVVLYNDSNSPTSPLTQTERLNKLHNAQKQRRSQQQSIGKQVAIYKEQFNSMEYIVGILDHQPEVSQIIFLSDAKQYSYGIKYDGHDYESSIFQPSVIVTYVDGNYNANIMLSRYLSKLCAWKKGQNYKAHYYTLQSNHPQWSSNFIEDFSIVRVHMIFDILYTLRLKRLLDNDEPIPVPKYKMKRVMRWWMAKYLKAWIRTLKRLCDEENVLEPPPPISNENFDMLWTGHTEQIADETAIDEEYDGDLGGIEDIE